MYSGDARQIVRLGTYLGLLLMIISSPLSIKYEENAKNVLHSVSVLQNIKISPKCETF